MVRLAIITSGAYRGCEPSECRASAYMGQLAADLERVIEKNKKRKKRREVDEKGRMGGNKVITLTW